MKQISLLTSIFAVCVFSGCGLFNEPSKKDQLCPKETTELRNNMRKLWEDHIVYTHGIIVSLVSNLPDKEAVKKRLMQNQDDIGNAMKLFYGEQVSAELAKLLKVHELTAGDIIEARLKRDAQKAQAERTKWYANADQIVALLAKANPNWTERALKDLFYKHLEMTEGQFDSRLKADWAGDISYYDKGHECILEVADALTNGIVKQFPDKFECLCPK